MTASFITLHVISGHISGCISGQTLCRVSLEISSAHTHARATYCTKRRGPLLARKSLINQKITLGNIIICCLHPIAGRICNQLILNNLINAPCDKCATNGFKNLFISTEVNVGSILASYKEWIRRTTTSNSPSHTCNLQRLGLLETNFRHLFLSIISWLNAVPIVTIQNLTDCSKTIWLNASHESSAN